MNFSNDIIAWYQNNKRDLPWRDTKSVYHVWLSEIILQQTRVAQGLSYYYSFVEAFPDVYKLAEASEDEVLKLWQGLGYYSRARNLHSAAKFVVNELNGEFPSTFKELKKLKGVGNYTAAAIASFCYQEPVAVVDGNVYRVLSRYFDASVPIDSTEGKKYFQQLATQCLNPKTPDDHNQAIMEFGALQCTPSPDCSICPLQNSCASFANKTYGNLPVKTKKIKQVTRYFNYLVVTDGISCILEKRTQKDIWKNLFQFPLIESEKDISDPVMVMNGKDSWKLKHCSQTYKHVLSHQVIMAKFWEVETESFKKESENVVNWNEIHKYAVPRLIEKYLKKRI